MTLRLIDRPAFAESDGQTKTLNYRIVGTTSEVTARQAFLQSTAVTILTSFGTLWREPPVIRQTAYDQFDIQVTYSARSAQLGSYTWDFDTTGGTVHITQAKEDIASYAVTGNAPDNMGAIGIDGSNEPQGTEIVIPAFKLNVRFRHPLGVVTMPFAKALHNVTGKVASTPFFNWAAGEVLFLGARGSDGSDAEAEVNYSFAMSANATGLTIGAIANIAKKGWEYLWITYKDAVSNSERAAQPKFVYVQRVYDTADLKSILGFG